MHGLRLHGVAAEAPAGLADRIWRRDASVWGPGEDDPGARLGWLDLPRTMAPRVQEMQAVADRALAGGVEAVALLGMGGSSLAPEVFASVLAAPAAPRLTVCDSTHPRQVAAWRGQLPLDRTLFVVSSKSGATVETLSLYRYFRALADDGARFVAITDRGTSLERLAEAEGFAGVCHSPPDVGGRFSALAPFGLLPAALVGVDIDSLLARASDMAAACRVEGPGNPGLVLGAAVGRLALEGRDKLTFLLPEPLESFGDWLEQLLAESTGKRGTGVVPIVREPPCEGAYGRDRAFVDVGPAGRPPPQPPAPGQPLISADLADPLELGAHMFMWEFAAAVAGSLLGVNPFDQPGVEAAKRATMEALGAGHAIEWLEDDPDKLFADLRPGDLACLLVFAPFGRHAADVLRAARRKLLREHGVATMAGFGPRYLHSSGQLHKGGPPRVRALVVLDPPQHDEPVPGMPYGFARLVAAQAHGDSVALERAGRQVARTTWQAFEEWTQS